MKKKSKHDGVLRTGHKHWSYRGVFIMESQGFDGTGLNIPFCHHQQVIFLDLLSGERRKPALGCNNPDCKAFYQRAIDRVLDGYYDDLWR